MKFVSLVPRLGPLAALCLLALGSISGGHSQDAAATIEEITLTADDAWELYFTGRYGEAVEAAAIGRERDSWSPAWDRIVAESLLAQGKYEDAYAHLLRVAEEWPYELRFRMLLREAALRTGRAGVARAQLEDIALRVNSSPRRYSYNTENLVVIGETALAFGLEPRIALESFFKRAQEEANPPMSAFRAAGELALSKRDYALASRQFQAGIERYEGNPYLWSGLAASFREDDRAQMLEYAQRALAIDPRHPPALLLQAEHLTDGEAYSEANAVLETLLGVNPQHAEALALSAAIRYLQEEPTVGDALRQRALAHWSSNPHVDFIIGRKLSQNYRFEEGASFQRRALLSDDAFVPARAQLAQDLLRLGHESEGWKLAAEAHEQDPYDIVSYNLVTLNDRLKEFDRLESDHFVLRLEPKEARIYGQRALELLESAHAELSARYGIELPQKTLVEIFPNPADFETRTFGMPGSPGYLGVCFGPVFTINSPATRSANWEAVLYHEFCHSITLTLSRNRMPRWLSEGISVHEETLANPAWGRRLTAEYRDRILSGRMQPISNMSAAFLQAQDGEDVQFAYFQSALIVEYLFDNYGIDAMRSLLRDLGEGIEIGDALSARMAPLPQLDEAFAAFAQKRAADLAPQFRFGPPGQTAALPIPAGSGTDPQFNYDERLAQATQLLQLKDWAAAADHLQALIDQAGYLPDTRNAHLLLAAACRELGDRELEKELLETVASSEAHRLEPLVRLLEIAQDDGDPEAATRWSNSWLAINPMAITPQRALYEAAQRLNRPDELIASGRSLIALDATDAPAIHLEIARALRTDDLNAARRHTLLALETAPRFREAYQLLDALPPGDAPEQPAPKEYPARPDFLNHLETDNRF